MNEKIITGSAGAGFVSKGASAPAAPIGPDEIAGPEPETTQALLRKLARALRTQRRLARAGHWAYDLDRHMGLVEAWRRESGS